MDVDEEEDKKEEDRAVDDPWEEVGGEGIAIKTATLIAVGEEDLSSVIEMFVGAVLLRWVVASSAEAGRGEVGRDVGLKNIFARVSKEGPVEASVVR